MKRIGIIAVVALAGVALGLVAGRGLSATAQEETNYMVIQEFTLGEGQSVNEGIAEMSDWVRAFRATGKHSSVRLFMHEWGSEAAFYIISETNDWSAIGTMFADLLAAKGEFMDEPFGFASHSDEILAEIPVE